MTRKYKSKECGKKNCNYSVGFLRAEPLPRQRSLSQLENKKIRK